MKLLEWITRGGLAGELLNLGCLADGLVGCKKSRLPLESVPMEYLHC